MDQQIFLQRYRICTTPDGSAEQLGRNGVAINYKGIDEHTGAPVLVQLVPVAALGSQREEFEQRARAAAQIRHINVASVLAVGVEHEYLVVVAEYLEGETADAWVVTHGPMQADAVLRVGIQVLRAVAAAAFYRLTHGAIQPSKIMIVPGQTEDGGWPPVKLIDLGLSGVELHSPSREAERIAPAATPEFASPEQLLGHEIDFRSEVYSLGATMFFLLTGAVPLAVTAMKARLRLRSLPELRRAPRALRNLLVWMLRENPQNRPQDPVALETALRDCLLKVDRHFALRRRLGIPLAGVIRKQPRRTDSPLRQVVYGTLAVALLMGVATAVGAYFFPTVIPLWHRGGEIGVPVGVPEANTASAPPAQIAQVSQPKAASSDVAQPSASSLANAQQTQSAPPVLPSPAATAPVIASANANSSAAVAPAPATTSEPAEAAPAPPADSADDQQSSASAETGTREAATTSRVAKAVKRSAIKTRRAIRRAQPVDEAGGYQDDSYGEAGRHSVRARVVGTTADGRLILRLPSGRVVFVSATNADTDLPVLPRRRLLVPRPYMEPPPDYYPND